MYFTGGDFVSSLELWGYYHEVKQTYKQLSIKYNCSERTIRRKLDSYVVLIRKLRSIIIY